MAEESFSPRDVDRVQGILREDQEPGWFERLGLRYFARVSARGASAPQAARSDEELARRFRRSTFWGFVVAFTIGAISAGGSVFVERLYPEDACNVLWSEPCLVKYGAVSLATILLTAVEFAVLFIVSIHVVFSVACATGHARLEPEDIFSVPVPLLLARAALEIPDPVRQILGIDPLKRVSRKRLLVVGILYKAKVVLSNVAAKLVLRRVFGKSVLRVGADYVAVPVTGLWNGIVVWKVAREARLRLVGNLLARRIAETEFAEPRLRQLSPTARLCCLQAVGNSIVLTQNYHPNMLVLLARLYELIDLPPGAQLDDWDAFLANLRRLPDGERFFVLDLLSIAAAFDGKVSRLEKTTLGHAFGEHSDVYFARIFRLRDSLIAGELFKAIEECRLDFEPG